MNCFFCDKNIGFCTPASVLAPPSPRGALFLKWYPICNNHANSWWDGTDMEPIAFKPIPPRKELEALVWSKTHKDFKGVLNGERSITYLDKGGTTLGLLSEVDDIVLLDKLYPCIQIAGTF